MNAADALEDREDRPARTGPVAALLVYPTHENCREVCEGFLQADIDAVCYPARRLEPAGDEPADDGPANCWNGEADRAEEIGLPVVKTVCPTCPEQARCYREGYLGGLIEARGALVAIATHQRVAYSSFAEMVQDRWYVSIHENAIGMLRPTCGISEIDLAAVRGLVERLLGDPFYLDWFGEGRRRTAEGEVIHDPQKALQRGRCYEATLVLAELLDDLWRTLLTAERTTPWQPPRTTKIPDGFERLLFWALERTGTPLQGSPWRFLLAALQGELHAAVVLVSRRHGRGEREEVLKSGFGVRQNVIAPDRNIWFNDATMDADRLEAVLGAPVSDETPDGRLLLQHKATQILRDVTRRTNPEVFLSLVRAVVCRQHGWRRIGLITHQTLLPALGRSEPEFSRRIVKAAYFGSGEERSSNAWHQECDGLMVIGTPRVPPEAIAQYLVQVGEVAAACEESEWGEVHWAGASVSGEAVDVRARGYYDERWRRAHRDLVRATLVQAIGRGRGLLPEGVGVLVLSTEECGLTIADESISPLGDKEVAVWRAVGEITLGSPNTYLLGKASDNTAVSTARIAEHLSLSPAHTRALLGSLESRGLIRRVGQRSGWQLVRDALEAALKVHPTETTDQGIDPAVGPPEGPPMKPPAPPSR